jgi:hypothetical protein
MPSRKSLGGNLGQAGGMMAALGFKQAAPAVSELDRDDASPGGPPLARAGAAVARKPSVPPPSLPETEAVEPSPDAIARIATDLSAEVLQLGKRAAYWNRETLRSFLERAIEAEAARIAREQGLAALPAAPPLRRGRPLRA